MTSYNTWRRLRLARRITQTATLLLFLVFLFTARIDRSLAPALPSFFPYDATVFLELDPLLAFLSLLATGELYRNMLWALALAVATIFLGRFFCGWMCPMGTLNQLVSSVRNARRRGMRRIEHNRYGTWQRWKYLVLGVVTGAAALGALEAGIVDPIALLVRSFTLVVLPAWDVALSRLGASPILPPGWGAIAAHILSLRAQPAAFGGVLLVGTILTAILVANRWITRFWCRGLCPLGALLGVFSRWSLLGLRKDPDHCSGCDRCALDCQGGDDPQPGLAWRPSECHLCLNCVAACPERGIAFVFGAPDPTAHIAPDVRRRAVLASLAAGAAAVPVLRTDAHAARGHDPALVRPPGSAREEDFLARCVRCGACMHVCPTNALQPTLFEAGLEGIWSPMLAPRIGYCETLCVQCGAVCPTGAIAVLTSQEKHWNGGEAGGEPISIGTAFYDQGRCLPWAMATECIVCEEWCPVSPKAIHFEDAIVRNSSGTLVHVRRPHVDPVRCTGCGACVYACPVRGAPAIYVTSAGESRHPERRMLLHTHPAPRARENRSTPSARDSNLHQER